MSSNSKQIETSCTDRQASTTVKIRLQPLIFFYSHSSVLFMRFFSLSSIYFLVSIFLFDMISGSATDSTRPAKPRGAGIQRLPQPRPSRPQGRGRLQGRLQWFGPPLEQLASVAQHLYAWSNHGGEFRYTPSTMDDRRGGFDNGGRLCVIVMVHELREEEEKSDTCRGT